MPEFWRIVVAVITMLFCCYTCTSEDNSKSVTQNILALFRNCEKNIQRDSTADCSLLIELADLIEAKQLDSALIKIDNIMLSIGDPDDQLIFYLELLKARILYAKGLVAETLEMYIRLFDQSRKQSEFGWYAERINQLLGELYLSKKMYRQAIPLLLTSIDTGNVSFHVYFQIKAFQNLGIAYLHLEKFDSATYFLSESISVKEKTKDTLGLAISYMDVANVYYNQYLDNQAIPLFIKGLEFARLSGDPNVLLNANLNMAVVEENRGELKAALEYRKEYEKLQKDLWDRDKVWELAEQEKAFEVSLREKEIALQDAEIQTKSWQRNSAFAFGLVAVIVLVFTGWAYQRIRKSNLIIAEQNEELSQLNTTKNRLFSIISHDLKSPVLALQHSQQRLATGIENQPKEQIKVALEANARSAAATYRLLNNLLHWSLEQSDQLAFSPEPIGINRLVAQVLYDYQAPFLQKQIKLINEVKDLNINVVVDLNLMKTVLRNILDNAVKFTPEAGTVRISASEGEQVRLNIIDSGPGIPIDQLQDLQDSLEGKGHFQSENSTGLGLVLSQSILRKHGSSLHVTSKAGSGTQVEVYLPTSISAWER